MFNKTLINNYALQIKYINLINKEKTLQEYILSL